MIHSGSYLSFRFDRSSGIAIPLYTDGEFSCTSRDSAAAPTLACLDLKCTNSNRERSINVSASRGVGGPTTRLWVKHQRRLRPAIEAEDPYIAAILIALAQERRRQDNSSVEAAGEKVNAEETSGSCPTPSQAELSASPSTTSTTTESPQGTVAVFKVCNSFHETFLSYSFATQADRVSFKGPSCCVPYRSTESMFLYGSHPLGIPEQAGLSTPIFPKRARFYFLPLCSAQADFEDGEGVGRRHLCIFVQR